MSGDYYREPRGTAARPDLAEIERWLDPMVPAHRNNIRALIARVRELEAAMEWRPIETAPRDGTEILACAHDRGDRWYQAVAQWVQADLTFPRSDAGWFWPFAIRPTHWLPLWPPPKEPRA